MTKSLEQPADHKQLPVWEVEISLVNRTFTFLTTEKQRNYDGWNDIEPVGYLILNERTDSDD